MSATVQALHNTLVSGKNIPTGGVRALLDEIETLKSQLENQAEIIEVLQKQSGQDELTGLTNRRGFDEAIEKAMSDFNRYNRQGALILIDLNDFKQVNDTLGHQAGDAVLAHVAEMLLMHTRQSDTVARIGGDEFCIILQEASAAEANLKRKELMAVLAGTPCVYGEHDIYTSASIGVSTFNDAMDKEELIEQADSQMYHAKSQHHSRA